MYFLSLASASKFGCITETVWLSIVIVVGKLLNGESGNKCSFGSIAVLNRICWVDRGLIWRDLSAVFSGFPDGCSI